MHLYSRKAASTAMRSAAAIALLMLQGQVMAADESELAQRSGCLACHKGVEQLAGPPYRDVAQKYAGQKDAEAKLVRHIIQGTGPDGVGWMREGKASLPFMPANGNVTPATATRLAKWILSVREELAPTSSFVTEALTVSGLVQHKLKLTVDGLRGFPPPQVVEFPMAWQAGRNRGKTEVLKGVMLRDIIEKAAVVSRHHNDVKKMAIIAIASDGYKVVFSWNEVFNTPVGDGVLVFFEKDGRALPDDEGRIAMVSARDIRSGGRHVKWLQAIEVRKIAD